MNILIVDDSKAMRMIVIRQLRRAGFGDATLTEACNGAEGLEMARATGPDLILSDWNMPEMEGIDFLRALRADGDPVPFGFVTSESTPEMLDEAVRCGANFVISKPFTPDDFEAALNGIAA
jgi:two-component system chemotaxis response regulator CheY